MAFANNIDWHYTFNLDGSTFSIMSEGTGEMVVYIKQPNDVVEEESPVTTLDYSNELGILVKGMFLHNASGELAPMLLFFSVDDMNEDDFEFYPIQGLRNTSDVGTTGFICFCKTRAGNKKFWKWFFEFYVLKFLKLIRTAYELKVIHIVISFFKNALIKNV